MITEIALGIVLGVVLLALIPVFLVVTLKAIRWIMLIGLLTVIAVLVLKYPAQIFGSALVIAASLMFIGLWALIPRWLANSNSSTSNRLLSLHTNYMALLDNNPPFQGAKWLPMRLLALSIAIVASTVLAVAALLAIALVWGN